MLAAPPTHLYLYVTVHISFKQPFPPTDQIVCICYHVQMGERPRLTDELEELAQSDKELEAKSQTLWFLVKLYRQCTKKDPADRPSAEDVYNLLLDHISSIRSRSPDQE